MLRLVLAWTINALALWICNGIFSSVSIHGAWAYIIGAAVLGIANTILKPILALLTLPLIIVTLGLFRLVINAALLLLVNRLVSEFHVDSFWAAFWAALVISLISLLLNTLTGTGNTRIEVRRGGRSSNGNDKGGGDGPVIDV